MAVTEYIGKNGKLQWDPPIVWPLYGYGHASQFSTVDDLRVFLGAMARGELVDKLTLGKLWQKSTLPNGRTGDFATGWEYGNSDLDWNVGHDNASGYTICENLGVDTCIRVFLLNTHLFAQSSNAWDSLADAYQKKGDRKKADSLYDKAGRLAAGQQ